MNNSYLNELTDEELQNINGGESIWYWVGVYTGVYLKTGGNTTIALITTAFLAS